MILKSAHPSGAQGTQSLARGAGDAHSLPRARENRTSLARSAGDAAPCREREGVPRFLFFSRASGPQRELKTLHEEFR